jgi:hypothetical protein
MRRTPMAVASTVVALVGVAAGGALNASGAASTASRSADLAVSGTVAGGEHSVESFHRVVFVFTIRNKGPGTVDSSADLGYTSVRNGSVSDQLCILPDGNSINPDSPQCEYGTLAPGQAARMALIVQPRTDMSGVPVTVRVCSSNESGIPDPVAANNCATRTVRTY